MDRTYGSERMVPLEDQHRLQWKQLIGQMIPKKTLIMWILMNNNPGWPILDRLMVWKMGNLKTSK
eukprot:5417136-Prorocentrum_lima.AAC.1